MGLCCFCDFLGLLQLKILYMPNRHIWGWHVLSFSATTTSLGERTWKKPTVLTPLRVLASRVVRNENSVVSAPWSVYHVMAAPANKSS